MKKIIILSLVSISAFASQIDYWRTVPCEQLKKHLQHEFEKPYDTSRDFPVLTFVQCPELLKIILQKIIDKNNPIHMGVLKRALRHAIMIDQLESARLLLEFGVSAVSRSGDPMNYVRSEEMVDLLIEFGGHVNRTEDYSTPLYWALDGRFLSAVKGLLHHGADKSAVSRKLKAISLNQWLDQEELKAQTTRDDEYLNFILHVRAIASL
ncbi:ankyrin repeat domain-containing protein [Candidatus Dependentiae bacterium]|nr:ankyrin repeat domain-containing protein [Candidatus Dependentiae bacterium]